jgi:hypothetical protein
MAENTKKTQKKQEILFVCHYAESGALPVDLSKLFSVWADQVISEKDNRTTVATDSIPTNSRSPKVSSLQAH